MWEKTWFYQFQTKYILFKKTQKKASHIQQPKIEIIWHYKMTTLFSSILIFSSEDRNILQGNETEM